MPNDRLGFMKRRGGKRCVFRPLFRMSFFAVDGSRFAEYFDDAVALHRAVASLSDETVVISAVGGVGAVGIPEVVFLADVVDLEYKVTPTVVDGEVVVGVAVVFN